jgi:methylated-DNA-[protein]-cysteine S-methyltransferase
VSRWGAVDTVYGPAFVRLDDDGALAELHFDPARGQGDRPAPAHLEPVARQLGEYSEGRRVAFDLRLRPRGTPFRQEVWKALTEIPIGRTTTYGELARKLGRPAAYRAVGAANGANPIMLVIPCHRVIGSDGGLTGFGGGLPLKARMLEFEREAAGRG